MTRATCETCQYFDASAQCPHAAHNTTGMCRRWPPAVAERTGFGMWPYVEYGEWCGEHREPSRNAAVPADDLPF